MKISFLVILFSIGVLCSGRNVHFAERFDFYTEMIECESYKKPGGNSLVTTLNETAKFTLFVVGQKPISILMSNDNNTNCFHYRTCDFYKFLISPNSSWIEIRKGFVSLSKITRALQPTKIEIEISKDGQIELYINDSLKPVAIAFDQNPIDVKHVYFNSSGLDMEFFYDCPTTTRRTNTSEALPNGSRDCVCTEKLKLVECKDVDQNIAPVFPSTDHRKYTYNKAV